MHTAIINVSRIQQQTNKNLVFFLFVAIILSFGITIFVFEKPTDIPADFSTDIDWTKPPCNPDELSDNWKETTHKNMKNKYCYKSFLTFTYS